ncbi:DNA polymerase Y family protein [Gallaecimonas kandeliae]|uniref:Y-family DNA polymerase n=1 Tax=Gallaecimonas kandeliae TaxID=3029055 RepID=UPI0026495928|nr:DNA polymerase Y family protein [Gallaecimonas kandeliae]WKE66803.1 DNA polymerase Y family protein [Gallaecimonas kandeliae]
MRWLYLHFPDLPLELASRGLPQEKPLATLDNRQQLQCLNPAALAAGLDKGMSLAGALTLSPDLKALSVSPLQCHQGLQALADSCYDLAGPLSLVPPDGLLVELSSMQRLYGNDQALLACLQDKLQALGHRLQPGMGTTPLAARLLARAEIGPASPQQGWQALLALPVSALELPLNLEAKLARAGLRQLGQLLALPRQELGQRYGAPLLSTLGRLDGSLKEARQLYHPSEQFERRLDFIHEVERAQGLLFPLGPLLEALALFLEKRQLACERLQLNLHFRQGPSLDLVMAGAEPLHRAEDWRAIVQLQLEKLQLDSPVLALTLKAAQLSPRQRQSKGLFTPPRPDEPLLGRLITRLGESAVQGLCLVENHCPEKAQAWVSPGAGNAVRPLNGLRPLWLLEKPEPLEEIPVLLRGPERLENGWWQQAIQRDYFIARHPQGGLCWIFLDKDEGWYLHGWFG